MRRIRVPVVHARHAAPTLLDVSMHARQNVRKETFHEHREPRGGPRAAALERDEDQVLAVSGSHIAYLTVSRRNKAKIACVINQRAVWAASLDISIGEITGRRGGSQGRHWLLRADFEAAEVRSLN
eukprot:scaffold1790_cov257-Pinguiococcus_pyrenoidosus.AAC.9